MMFEILLFLLGLIFGSFINSFLWRYQTKTTFKGRSMCPACKHQLAWHDNIPLVSWIMLSGKCRYCKKSISVQYPLVELLTGTTFLLIGHYSNERLAIKRWVTEGFYLRDSIASRFLAQNIIALAILLAVAGILITISVYDIKTKEIPNGFNLTFVVLTGLYLVTSSLSLIDPLRHILLGLVSAIAAFAFFYAFVFFSKETWMGGGDAKLAFGMGLLLGPLNTFVGILLASWIGSIYGITQLLINKKNLSGNHQIPFGPFLALGTIISLLFGSQLTLWYARIFLGI